MRGLEREDRIIWLRLTSNDHPGLLGKVAGLLGAHGANILAASHSRRFLDLPAKGVSIDLTIEARGRDHVQEIGEALTGADFAVRRVRPQHFAKDIIA